MTAAASGVEAVGERIEALLDELAAAEPVAAKIGERLVRELLALYGAGLERILEIVRADGPLALDALASDHLVGALLALHDLHPVEVTVRVQQALDDVRPYLGSHGGDVTLLGVEEGIVRLRLEGSCDGCASSEATLKLAVEGAIRKAVPEMVAIEVDGATAPVASNGTFVPASSLSMRRSEEPAQEWVVLDMAPPVGTPTAVGRDLDGGRVVLCRAGEDLYAYRDACAVCGASLEGAALDGDALTCPGCARHYDVRVAGRALGGNHPALVPVPLLEDASGVRVAAEAAR